jgi:hypothetical protein
MFDIGALFQWERFITPSIIKVFYWLALVAAVLAGIELLITGLGLVLVSPIAALLTMIAGLLTIGIGVIGARMAAEFVLIVFRINEHLGAIRGQGEPR